MTENTKYFFDFGYMAMIILKNGHKVVLDQYPELKQLGDWKIPLIMPTCVFIPSWEFPN